MSKINLQSGFWKILSFFAILIVILLLFRTQDSNNPNTSPSPETQPERERSSSGNSKYLGISREKMMNALEQNEANSGNSKPEIFKEEKTEKGEPSVFITFGDNETMVNLLGKKNDLSSVSILMSIKDDRDLIEDQISRENAMVETALPGWKDHQKWFQRSVKKLSEGEKEVLTEQDGAMVYLTKDSNKLFLAVMSKKWISEQ